MTGSSYPPPLPPSPFLCSYTLASRHQPRLLARCSSGPVRHVNARALVCSVWPPPRVRALCDFFLSQDVFADPHVAARDARVRVELLQAANGGHACPRVSPWRVEGRDRLGTNTRICFKAGTEKFGLQLLYAISVAELRPITYLFNRAALVKPGKVGAPPTSSEGIAPVNSKTGEHDARLLQKTSHSKMLYR